MIGSPFTKNILERIDYQKIRRKRHNNLLQMHYKLKKYNLLNINISSKTHIFYPLMFMQENLRYRLLKRKIYNPMLWEHVLNNVPEDSLEFKFSKYVVLLPIDQRYSKKDINIIANTVIEEMNI